MENCLNCGAPLEGEYCHKCGQKRITRGDRSVAKFLQNFVEEFFTFDAKFFRSFKLLLAYPGELTNEYIKGKVNRYISPLKMYLFMSLVTFFISSLISPEKVESFEDLGVISNIGNYIIASKNISKDMLAERFNNEMSSKLPLYMFGMILMFSLPLKLIYLSKKRYYVEHLVFALHYFSFIMLCFTVSGIMEMLWPEVNVLFYFVIPFFYLFISIHNVYKQSVILTFFESVILFLYYFLLLFSVAVIAYMVALILV